MLDAVDDICLSVCQFNLRVSEWMWVTWHIKRIYATEQLCASTYLCIDAIAYSHLVIRINNNQVQRAILQDVDESESVFTSPAGPASATTQYKHSEETVMFAVHAHAFPVFY